ncbi:MAG: DUF5668 domain-containing protein [Ignavibacterium sp.]
MKLKLNRLFWGIFFLTAGILFLLKITLDYSLAFGDIIDFWPILLIVLGLSFIMKNEILKTIFVLLIGITLGILTFHFFDAAINFFERDFFKSHRNKEIINTERLFEEYDKNIKEMNINIKGGASSIEIKGNTEKMYEIIASNLNKKWNFDLEKDSNIASLNLQMKNVDLHLNDKEKENYFSLLLNKNLIYSFNIELGAASADINLSDLLIKTVDLDAGVSSIDIKLGQPAIDTLKANLNCGASSIKIQVPANIGCELYSDLGLSSKNINGFNKVKENLYRTANFDSTYKKIFFNLEGGILSLKVDRY